MGDTKLKHKVEVELGYEFALNPKDPYSKEKGVEFLTYTIVGDIIDRDEVRREARKVAREVKLDIKQTLKEEGAEILAAVEELKNSPSPEIDKLRAELSAEYDGKLKKAKEIIEDLQRQIKLLKK